MNRLWSVRVRVVREQDVEVSARSEMDALEQAEVIAKRWRFVLGAKAVKAEEMKP